MRTQSPLPNALDAHEAQQRQRRAERIVVITGALGLGVAAFALWWPGPPDGPSVITPLHPVVAPASSPSPTPVSALEPGVVTDAGVMEVVATTPLVALPHEEQATDFAAVAKDAIERGEPEVALEALRKQVYTTPPTARVLLDVGRLAAQVGHYALAEQANSRGIGGLGSAMACSSSYAAAPSFGHLMDKVPCSPGAGPGPAAPTPRRCGPAAG
jgi:hypothetical protein